MIGRLGRSLGVHLLLASQRLEEGRLRGLDTHLSYRIGLRTFSAVESRIVLGVPDAYELPNAPGHGYLKADTQTMLRFRAAYVSGPYRRGRRGAALARRRCGGRSCRTASASCPVPASRAEEPEAAPARRSEARQADLHAGRDRGPAARARARRRTRCGCRRWPSRRAWTSCSATLAVDPRRGLVAAGLAGRRAAQRAGRHGGPPVRAAPRPARGGARRRRRQRGHRRRPAVGQEHDAALAARPRWRSPTRPREVQFFCLDFGGGALRGAGRAAAHVAGWPAAATPRRSAGRWPR